MDKLRNDMEDTRKEDISAIESKKEK